MRLEQTISLDQQEQATLTVSNPLDHPVAVQISAGPYRSFQPELRIPSSETWLHFEPGRFTLAPHASTTVQIQINPPPAISNDTAGEYLAALVIDQLPAEEPGAAQGSRVTVVPRLAIPVYLQVRGREQVAVELADVSLKILQQEPSLLRIDTTLRNKGTIHVRLTGSFALFDETGKLVRSGPLGKTVPILPSADLSVPTLFPTPPAGRYKLALTVESGSSPRAAVRLPLAAAAGPLLQREVPFEITEDGRVTREKK